MNLRERIDDFLRQKRLAMVGVSRDGKEFSRLLFQEFKRRGYEIAPVHPAAEEIGGEPAFARVQDVNPPVGGVLIMTKPEVTEEVVKDCAEAGVRRVWMYQSIGAGAVSQRAVAFCEESGMDVIPGYCPYMFFPNPGWFHSLHTGFMKLTGTYPR